MRNIVNRFLSRLKIQEECILWTGAINNSGYGSIRGRYITIGVHIFSYELHSGIEVKKNYEPHHKCLNKNCVRFEHLELLTKAEHMSKHRQEFCKRGHKMTPENTVEECYSGAIHRRCKECKNMRQRKLWNN